MLDKIIEASNGRFFSVVFIKKDGTQRHMVARLGVTKHLKGGQCTLDKSRYIVAYDVEKGGYRAINRETIVSCKLDGVEYAY